MGRQIAPASDEHSQQSCVASDVVFVTDKSAEQRELSSHLETASQQLDSKLSLLCFTALHISLVNCLHLYCYYYYYYIH